MVSWCPRIIIRIQVNKVNKHTLITSAFLHQILSLVLGTFSSYMENARMFYMFVLCSLDYM